MKKVLSLLLLLSIAPVTIFAKSPSTQIKKKPTIQAKSIKSVAKKPEITVITVDSSNFDKLVINASTPILLDVYADWCGPCRRMSPVFEEVSKKHKGKKIVFAKIKMDGFGDSDPHVKLLIDKLNVDISSIPTFLYIEKGKLVEQITGSQNAANLNTKIASLMKKSTTPKRNLA